MQLILTTVIGYIGYNSVPFQEVLVSIPIIIIVSVGLLALSIVIGCCTNFFRKYALPIFITFTVLMSLLVAISICGLKSKVILLAVGITLVVTIGLTIFACSLAFM
jgi:FtsH-binding integral membrane protein